MSAVGHMLTEVICSSCGASSPAEASFCSSCGQDLHAHGDERRIATVLFADVVGFTGWSERMDPERVKAIIDSVFERLVADVDAFGGRVDKIVGDCIVALFGAPVAHEDDAERAVRAALRMQETLAAYVAEHDLDVRIRIGVNSGEVLVGALRSGGDYTAMGDVVNTASRLQTMAEPGEVLVGGATYDASATCVAYEKRGDLELRGRVDTVPVFVALGITKPPGYRNRSRAELVGRDDELKLVERLVRVAIKQRRAQVVVITGEAGVGKTRLANEIAPMVHALNPDAFELRGRCLPYGEANPWWPVAEMIRNALGLGLDATPDQTRAACSRLIDVLIHDDEHRDATVDALMHTLGHDTPMRSYDPHSVFVAAADALARLAEASAHHQPLLIRLSDLQWADDAVLEIINSAATVLARQPVILVLTSRSELFERWNPPSGKHNLCVLNLDVLDREPLGELLDSLTTEPLDVELREDLLNRSGGNPLYLEELAMAALAEGEGASAGHRELPTTLQGLVSARLDDLSADELASVEDAAVWGPRGPFVALSEIGRYTRGAENTLEVVVSLAEKEIFVFEDDVWSFRSHLFAEVAYSRITKSDRLVRHAGIAAYLEAASEGRYRDDGFVDTVARHYFEAAQLYQEIGSVPGLGSTGETLVAKALDWLIEGARRAESSAFWALSVRLYRRGLVLLDGAGDDPLRLKLLLASSRSLCEMWRFDEALVDANLAQEIAERLDDPSAVAHSIMLRGHARARKGNLDEAVLLLDDSVDRFDALGDVAGRAESLRIKGMSAIFGANAQAAEEPIQQALDAFREIGDPRGEAWALQNLAWITFMTGNVEVAEERLNRSAEVFASLGDTNGIAWTRGLLAFIRFQQGQLVEARAIASDILAQGKQRGDRWAEAMMHVALGSIDLWEGQTRLAAEHATQAAEIGRVLGDVVALKLALSVQARAASMMGLVLRANELASEAISVTAGGGDIAGIGELTLIMIQLQTGQPIDTEWVEALAIAPPGASPSDAHAALVLAQLQRGNTDAALKAIEAVSGVTQGRSMLDAVAALACVAAGDLDQATEFASRVTGETEISYVDRVLAWLAVAAVSARRDPQQVSSVFEQIDAVLAPTEDRLTPGIVGLFRNALAHDLGQDSLVDSGLSRRWHDLGVTPVGWLVVVDQIVEGQGDTLRDELR